jgi:hypothetical protein
MCAISVTLSAVSVRHFPHLGVRHFMHGVRGERRTGFCFSIDELCTTPALEIARRQFVHVAKLREAPMRSFPDAFDAQVAAFGHDNEAVELQFAKPARNFIVVRTNFLDGGSLGKIARWCASRNHAAWSGSREGSMSRRQDKGRLPPFVPLIKTTIDCPAWKAMSHGARSLYVALKRRYSQNFHNNGRIFSGGIVASSRISAAI